MPQLSITPLRVVLVETGPVEDGCKCNVSVVLQHLVCDNVGVLDQLEDLLNDVHVGNLDVVGQGDQHLSHLNDVELVGHNHFLEEHDSWVGSGHLDGVKEQSPLDGLVLDQLKDGLDLLQLVHSNHVLERLQNGGRLLSSKVLNIVESLCDGGELFYNLGPDCWSHFHELPIRSEHVVGGVHCQTLEVILLLLEAGDLHPLLARDGLGVFKQKVLHNSRCNDLGQDGESLPHLLKGQNLPCAGHHLLGVEANRFCWCSPSLMIACSWKSFISVPQPRNRVNPTFPLTPLHPPTRQFSWPLVAMKRLLSVHLVMSRVLISWKIFLPSHM